MDLNAPRAQESEGDTDRGKEVMLQGLVLLELQRVGD